VPYRVAADDQADEGEHGEVDWVGDDLSDHAATSSSKGSMGPSNLSRWARIASRISAARLRSFRSARRSRALASTSGIQPVTLRC